MKVSLVAHNLDLLSKVKNRSAYKYSFTKDERWLKLKNKATSMYDVYKDADISDIEWLEEINMDILMLYADMKRLARGED